MCERIVKQEYPELEYEVVLVDAMAMHLISRPRDFDVIVTENLFSGRFRYVSELVRMGADIRTEGHHAVVRGVDQLSGAPVRAPDIRAGAALVVSSLGEPGAPARALKGELGALPWVTVDTLRQVNAAASAVARAA